MSQWTCVCVCSCFTALCCLFHSDVKNVPNHTRMFYILCIHRSATVWEPMSVPFSMKTPTVDLMISAKIPIEHIFPPGSMILGYIFTLVSRINAEAGGHQVLEPGIIT